MPRSSPVGRQTLHWGRTSNGQYQRNLSDPVSANRTSWRHKQAYEQHHFRPLQAGLGLEAACAAFRECLRPRPCIASCPANRLTPHRVQVTYPASAVVKWPGCHKLCTSGPVVATPSVAVGPAGTSPLEAGGLLSFQACTIFLASAMSARSNSDITCRPHFEVWLCPPAMSCGTHVLPTMSISARAAWGTRRGPPRGLMLSTGQGRKTRTPNQPLLARPPR